MYNKGSNDCCIITNTIKLFKDFMQNMTVQFIYKMFVTPQYIAKLNGRLLFLSRQKDSSGLQLRTGSSRGREYKPANTL